MDFTFSSPETFSWRLGAPRQRSLWGWWADCQGSFHRSSPQPSGLLKEWTNLQNLNVFSVIYSLNDLWNHVTWIVNLGCLCEGCARDPIMGTGWFLQFQRALKAFRVDDTKDSRSASWRIIFRRCSFLLSPYSPYQSMHGCVTSTRLCYLIFATASLSIIGYTSLFEPFSSSATAFLNNSNPLWMLHSRLWMQTCCCSRHLEALHSWWDCKLKHSWIWYSLIFQYDEYNWV